MTIDPGEIGKINSLKSQAKDAYKKGDFKTAISKYRYLVDSLGVQEDEVKLNLANAYFQSNDTTNTATSYQPLTQSTNPKIRSIAHQQLGVLSNRQNKHEEALANFKQALKADPTNDDARYNYEMVKKKNKEQNKEQKQDQKEKQDQQNKDKKDQEQKEKQDQEQKEKEKKEQQKKDQEKEQKENKDKKDLPPSVSEKLKQMEMSEEKAKMILEAMKNQEIQYLQQNKRKATKPKDKGKPDW